MKMDSIILKGLAFYGSHGVLPREKNCPQRFIVDVEMFLDLKQAAASDCLEATVNYDEVFHTVRGLVEEKSFELLETLADQICRAILEKYQVNQVQVTVKKPQAPVDGEFDYFAVKMIRQC